MTLRRRGLGPWAVVVLLCMSSDFAAAQAPAEAASTPAAPEKARTGDFDPIAARQAALDQLEAGWFEEAAAAFDVLAARAEDDETRAWSLHLARMARRWHARRLTLVPRTLGAAEEQAERTARAARRRTSGEMATLYVDGVIYGFGTGLYAAELADADGATAFVLPALLLSGGVAAGIAIADHHAPFGYAVPRSVSAGLRLGLAQGALWTGWQDATRPYEESWTARQALTVVWLATTAGGVLGGVAGDRLGVTPGAASLVESGGLWSGLVGVLTGLALDDGGAGALLGGAVAVPVGALAGGVLAAHAEPEPARVRYLDLGGVAGGLLFGGLYVAFAGDFDPVLFCASTSLGIISGLGTAWAMTADMPRDPLAGWGLVDAHFALSPTPEGGVLGLVGRW